MGDQSLQLDFALQPATTQAELSDVDASGAIGGLPEANAELSRIRVDQVAPLSAVGRTVYGDYRGAAARQALPGPTFPGNQPVGRGLPGRYNGDFQREGYDRIYENEFMAVGANPLSTFGIDVDRASYSNVRRFIRDG